MSQQPGSTDGCRRSAARVGPSAAKTPDVALGAGAFGDVGVISRLASTVAFARSWAIAVSSAETEANCPPARHQARAAARSAASALRFGAAALPGDAAMITAAADSEAQASKPSASVSPAERSCRSVKPIRPTRGSRPRSAAPTARATPSPAEATCVSVTPSRTASGCTPLSTLAIATRRSRATPAAHLAARVSKVAIRI